MRKLRKNLYGCAPAHTIFLGPGRKEFHPKKPRPGIEHYIFEAGRASIAQVAHPEAIDQGVIGNFMAARFNRQGHLNAFLPARTREERRDQPRTEGGDAHNTASLGCHSACSCHLFRSARIRCVNRPALHQRRPGSCGSRLRRS